MHGMRFGIAAVALPITVAERARRHTYVSRARIDVPDGGSAIRSRRAHRTSHFVLKTRMPLHIFMNYSTMDYGGKTLRPRPRLQLEALCLDG